MQQRLVMWCTVLHEYDIGQGASEYILEIMRNGETGWLTSPENCSQWTFRNILKDNFEEYTIYL